MKRSLFLKATIIALAVSIAFCNANIAVFAAQGEILLEVDNEESIAQEISEETKVEEKNTEELNTEELNTEELNTEELNTEELNTEELNIEETEGKSDTSQEEEVECATGYIDDDFIIPSISESYSADTSTYSSDSASAEKDPNEAASTNATTYEVKGIGEIPVSYSFKGDMPAVRDQGIYGVCWSFAAIGAAEASIISKGLADNSIDLSELQLAYFFYHSVADPLGNTTGDMNQALVSDYLNVGGNSVFTTFALASWTGVADESKAPYSNASISGELDTKLAFEDAYHMQNAYWINLSTDDTEVKKMIMEYGAVASAHFTDQSTTTESTACYNPATYSYFYDGAYKTNHAIVIVGWDDNYSKDNFSASKQPTSDGAWLVRNSWGSTLGDQGYFWISYEDSAFNSDSYSKAFVFDFESANNYDHNYQYDGASGANGYSLASGGSIANVFTASGNSTGDQEKIDAVAFALYDVNVNYSIQIYTDLAEGADPTSGTPVLNAPKTGNTSYVGYYTIALDEEVVINEGEKFAVVITLSKNDGSTTYFFGDKSYQNDTWIKFTNATSSEQSFRKNGSSSNWYDLNLSGVTARIKAFTTDMETPIVEATKISLSESNLTMSKEQSMALTASLLPENVTNKSVTWSTSDSNVAMVDSNGLVIAVTPGTATITATTNNNLTASCLITVINEEQVKSNVKTSKIKQNQDSSLPENEEMVEVPIVVTPNYTPGEGRVNSISQNATSVVEDKKDAAEEETKISTITETTPGENAVSNTVDSNKKDEKTTNSDTRKDTAIKKLSDFVMKNGKIMIAISLLCLLPIRKIKVKSIKIKG